MLHKNGYLRRNANIESLSKKELRIEKLEFNIKALRDQLQQLRAEKTAQERAALRRQIAINIEYEVKCEMFVALKRKCRQGAVKRAELHELRDDVLAQSLSVPRLAQWLDFQDEDTWEKWTSAMHYLKAFSYEAHPTMIEGKTVSKEIATSLIDEPFDTSSVRKMEYPWNENLRSIARECLNTLSKIYRAEGEKLLYN
jgi:hypothetical protein